MNFNVNTELTIRGQKYSFVTMPNQGIYIDSTGGSATIYKLKHITTNKTFALKVFHIEYRDAYLRRNFDFIQEELATIPMFAWVTHRILINENDDRNLILEFPELRNSILMPWIDLPTADQIRSLLSGKRQTPTSTAKCRALAQLLADSLYQLEQKGFAHGDISSTNVLIDWERPELYIIDIEDMFHSTLKQPGTLVQSKGGTDGYRFFDDFTSWQPCADRFAGALLICELLTLDNPDCQQASAEESYFVQRDIDERTFDGLNNERIQALTDALSQLTNGIALATALDSAWTKMEIREIPSLSNWVSLLGKADYNGLFQQWLELPKKAVQPVPAITAPIPPQSQVPFKSISKADYNVKADSDNPALLVFLLDLSRSMFKYQTSSGKLRFEVALNLINELKDEFINRCRKQGGTRPRYHVAILGYHKETIDLLTPYHSRKTGENNEKKPANSSRGIHRIHPIGSLDGIKFDIAGINNVTPIGADIQSNPKGETHMTQAFQHAKKLIANNISTYKTSHPPFVFHITDGANVDKGDLATEFLQLTSLSTDYGKTLVTTAYIADNLIEQNTSTNWSGINDHYVFTNERAATAASLRSISSRIPEKYLDALHKKQYTNFKEDAYLFFPGTDNNMLQLAMTATKSTGG